MMGNNNYSTSFIRQVKGFTLLELLIAISLSAVLMTVLVVGLRQITLDFEKQGASLDQKIDESLLLRQLEKAILGTFAYRFKAQNLGKAELFFAGSNTELSWVSTVSPGRNNSLMVWHLNASTGNGFKLTVLPAYPGNLQQQLDKAKIKENLPIIYFKDYKVSLHYLVVTTNDKKQWQTSWSGKRENELPLGVRVQFERKENISENEQNFSVFSFIRVDANVK
ncbi:MAG: prepilin-type N-terminal cleavage/methylation domain-containing protein [gamma proteobacterium symbiont of Bathyaustriella thionipta]|nr:prepilin-type N-terminal cleavage/methylation domain-containing protein [gamma proteobacterium symbiont of Bathyaustriella thionipta]MCU7951314.1 prepilin-type N-terminal cleavage/methylation domain-containing protein [gamma proteobacterium symbiont of Bathyaustriella thionipta]MCU7952189.1 prepilin-type N-terminal cleavage/methylation domain-containing protein [gamma proteobacterium symbiont of Bathyaustriella thionipta]MCU7957869.1 prepilin-type N-terminal cleavage/methylation domain-contai